MSISLEIRGEVGCIVLTDIFDFTVQDDFHQIMGEILNNNKINRIAVDMAAVTFIDSSGIRLLLLLNKNANSEGKSLILINCPDGLREIFSIGGFDSVLMIR
jgi:anti-anti-sigma factor